MIFILDILQVIIYGILAVLGKESSLTLINKSASLTNAIQGELIIGDVTGATARVVTKTANNVEIIYTNDTVFSKEEKAVFQSSGI